MSKTNRSIFDEYDETIWTKIQFNENSNGYVVVHQHHGKGELVVNLPIALKLAEWGFCVELLAELKTMQTADSTLNGEFWEFKTVVGTTRSVQNRLREGKKQSDKVLLVLPSDYEIGEILRGIISAINVDKSQELKMVGLLTEFEFIVLSRLEIHRRDFSKLKHLF
ncbi:MAG: hypothetical protein JNL70_09625 [Saprospiraceae bacterium]|nr:hypothetical protein [Saprospiraceae bacterium]